MKARSRPSIGFLSLKPRKKQKCRILALRHNQMFLRKMPCHYGPGLDEAVDTVGGHIPMEQAKSGPQQLMMIDWLKEMYEGEGSLSVTEEGNGAQCIIQRVSLTLLVRYPFYWDLPSI